VTKRPYSPAAMDEVFKALCRPDRREPVDGCSRGRAEPRRARGRLPMSRFGRDEALKVVEAAGIVTTQSGGEKSSTSLTPSRPLIHDRWVAKYGRHPGLGRSVPRLDRARPGRRRARRRGARLARTPSWPPPRGCDRGWRCTTRRWPAACPPGTGSPDRRERTALGEVVAATRSWGRSSAVTCTRRWARRSAAVRCSPPPAPTCRRRRGSASTRCRPSDQARAARLHVLRDGELASHLRHFGT